jgi:hypothetical protein
VGFALNISSLRHKAVIGSVAVLAAGGAFLALGPAGASGSTHTSSVTVKYSGGHFSGKVASDTADCTIGRRVIIFKRGAHSTHNPTVGTATTNASGFYRLTSPPTSGVYYAVTRQVSLPGYANTVCGKARSSLIVIS